MRGHVISDIGEFVQGDADINDLLGYKNSRQAKQSR